MISIFQLLEGNGPTSMLRRGMVAGLAALVAFAVLPSGASAFVY
jgi:hypothetical protein